MHTTRIPPALTAPFIAIAIAGCGTSPSSRTPASMSMPSYAHVVARDQERIAAAHHDEEAEDATAVPGKTTEQGQERHACSERADEHEELAERHEAAARMTPNR